MDSPDAGAAVTVSAGQSDPQRSRNDRPALVDSFGRVHDRLRVSVTDRCNLRCVYCMPAEGATFRPRSEILTFEEIVRVVSVLSRCGIRKVRLTGGEPLVRTDLPKLAASIVALPDVADVGVTTNGLLLRRDAAALAEAGVRSLNVSLDALEPELFESLTRRQGLDRVLDGIEAAREAGIPSIKVNAVSIRGKTDSQLVPFGRFARESGLEVRFIEYMPLDADARWEREKVLFGHEIIDSLSSRFGPLREVASGSPAPATTYEFADGCGRIGIIPSVSRPFCAHCNRFRMTAEGQLRACLFSLEETDIRSVLRSGDDAAAVDDAIETAARSCLAGKWAGHQINEIAFRQPSRPMYSIGG